MADIVELMRNRQRRRVDSRFFYDRQTGYTFEIGWRGVRNIIPPVPDDVESLYRDMATGSSELGCAKLASREDSGLAATAINDSGLREYRTTLADRITARNNSLADSPAAQYALVVAMLGPSELMQHPDNPTANYLYLYP